MTKRERYELLARGLNIASKGRNSVAGAADNLCIQSSVGIDKFEKINIPFKTGLEMLKGHAALLKGTIEHDKAGIAIHMAWLKEQQRIIRELGKG